MRGNDRNRLLLEDLVADREPADHDPTPTVAPVLSVEPVPVPAPGSSVPRRARRRLSELEHAARWNLRSAEEARQALADEHRRLQDEAAARAHAAEELEGVRRELDRLRRSDVQRSDAAKRDAVRAARATIDAEVQRARAETERVLEELDRVRRTLADHDSLLEEYAERLREEQQARIALKAEFERAEMERDLVQRTLERAAESARQQAEDELLRAAAAEATVVETTAERDRLAAECDRLAAELAGLHAHVARLEVERPEEPAPAPQPASDRPPLARRRRKPERPKSE